MTQIIIVTYEYFISIPIVFIQIKKGKGKTLSAGQKIDLLIAS